MDVAAPDEIERRDGSRGVYAVVDKPHLRWSSRPIRAGSAWLRSIYPVRRRAGPSQGGPGGRTGDPEDLARLELAQRRGCGPAADPARLPAQLHGTSSQGFHVYHNGLTEGQPGPGT
jgi:hypothetical protein